MRHELHMHPVKLCHVGDSRGRRPFERGAVRIEGRPVHGLVACAAGPRGVPATVPKTGLEADQYLIRAERMPVRTSRRWVGDPLPDRCPHQLA